MEYFPLFQEYSHHPEDPFELDGTRIFALPLLGAAHFPAPAVYPQVNSSIVLQPAPKHLQSMRKAPPPPPPYAAPAVLAPLIDTASSPSNSGAAHCFYAGSSSSEDTLFREVIHGINPIPKKPTF